MAIAARQFRPPEWIIGTWEDGMGYIEYAFRERDVLTVFGGYSTSFKSIYEPYLIDSHGNSTEYEFTIKIAETEQTYRFTRVTDSTLNYNLITNGVETGDIRLKIKR